MIRELGIDARHGHRGEQVFTHHDLVLAREDLTISARIVDCLRLEGAARCGSFVASARVSRDGERHASHQRASAA